MTDIFWCYLYEAACSMSQRCCSPFQFLWIVGSVDAYDRYDTATSHNDLIDVGIIYHFLHQDQIRFLQFHNINNKLFSLSGHLDVIVLLVCHHLLRTHVNFEMSKLAKSARSLAVHSKCLIIINLGIFR